MQASNLISRFITALNKADIHPSSEELADILWLALQIDLPISREEKTINFDSSIADKTEANKLESENKSLPENLDKHQESKESTTQTKSEKSPLYPYQNGGGINSGGVKGQAFRTPALSLLHNALAFNRAFRPLRKKVTSRFHTELAIEETVQQIAETQLFLPVLTGRPERWLELVLIIDNAISMQLWQPLIKEFRRLLEWQGTFAKIYCYQLDTESENARMLANQRVIKNFEIITPHQPRLILVLSDCVAKAWHSDDELGVFRLLQRWGRSHPVSIMQMLPFRLWKGTALGYAEEARLTAALPLTLNQHLSIAPQDFWFVEDMSALQQGFKIPVLTLEPDSVNTWAKLLLGKKDAWLKGIVFDKPANLLPPPTKQDAVATELSAEQRLKQFRSFASPTAQQLAAYLATVPLDLSVMNVVQKLMLPLSSQVHLAEVFLGGLLKRVPHHAWLEYEFHAGVRDLLLDSVIVADAVFVLTRVSDFVEQRFGQSLDFLALLANPSVTDGIALNEQTRPFAEVGAKILKRLGGEYEKLVDALEKNFYEGLSNTELENSQNKFNDVDLLNNIEKIKLAFEDYESEYGEVSSKLSKDIGESILNRTIKDESIPNDNHEATINGYNEAEDIKLDFSELEYYGNGQFSIPFNLHIMVMVFYYIYKSDYYTLEYTLSVSDHNDHYFEAEDEFKIIVTGIVSITINQDNLNLDDFSESIELDSIAIDEIKNIELAEVEAKSKNQEAQVLVDIHHLPQPTTALIGRKAELAQLTEAFKNTNIHLAIIVAAGGIGKSALTDVWLQHISAENYCGKNRVFGWSFYSQGSHNTLTNSQSFFDTVLPFLGVIELPKGEIEKARLLAQKLREQPCLLILDGLEPLQYPENLLAMSGELQDIALKEFITYFGQDAGDSFVLLSSRQLLVELKSWQSDRYFVLDLPTLPYTLILWVDDHPDNNISERQYLEGLGFSFTLAQTTQEALEKIAQQHYAIIISDMGRREGSREGYVLLDKLRHQGNQTPFFFYASSNSPKHKQETLAHGGQGCTNNAQELFQMITQAISESDGVLPRQNKKKIFISYSIRDERHKETLIKHLSVLRNRIDIFHDTDLFPGKNWYEHFKEGLQQADIVLFLVSADSLSSSFQVQKLLLSEKNREYIFIPIIVSPCLWHSSKLAEYQVLPRNGIPITDTKPWHNEDQAWLEVVKEIQQVLDSYPTNSKDDFLTSETEREQIEKTVIENPLQKFISSLTETALESLTVTCNISALHVIDQDKIKSTLKALHAHGEKLDSVAIQSWLLDNNWESKPAKFVAETANKIASGKQVRLKSKHFFESSNNLIERLQKSR